MWFLCVAVVLCVLYVVSVCGHVYVLATKSTAFLVAVCCSRISHNRMLAHSHIHQGHICVCLCAGVGVSVCEMPWFLASRCRNAHVWVCVCVCTSVCLSLFWGCDCGCVLCAVFVPLSV